MKKNLPSFPDSWAKLFLSATLMLSSFAIQAQTAPAVEWDRTFGGTSDDILFSIDQTSDGGYVLGGSSMSGIGGSKSQASKGSFDFWVIKLDAAGNKTWDKTIGGNSEDMLHRVKQTADGGYILGGMSNSYLSGDKTAPPYSVIWPDLWIVKLDANGNKEWDKTLGGSELDGFVDILPTSDGGFVIGASSSSFVSNTKSQPTKGASDYWLIKLDAAGNKVWDNSIGGSGDEQLTDIQPASDGGFLLTGSSTSGAVVDKSDPRINHPWPDYWLVKTDSAGNKAWDKTIAGHGWDKTSRIVQTPDGGYLLGGNSDPSFGGTNSPASFGLSDIWIAKLDSARNITWHKSFGGNGHDQLQQLHITPDGNFILAGQSESGANGSKGQASFGGSDFWILKTDPNGNIIWETTLGSDSTDLLFSLFQTTNNGLIAGGRSASGSMGTKTQASQGGFDLWIVKLAPEVTGAKETQASFDVAVYPNPNQGKFTLQLHNLNVATVSISVADLLGKKIFEKTVPVLNSTLLEEITLPQVKGLYLLQLKAGAEVVTRKVVVE
ncbi:MAG: T9SS type A sorting domain-containing protein [Hymenobacteraceae bacterium]|nr:T9SS type A sorting domain-containing protein [Hymenobacteraceae bacterium]MDX5397289.1 T9SS type A sorting domain-containing protein [Hymenobacteraceae bacterium]MDX5513367.1 T9SS type A sorting domain-containing protein [Hymenobacteraceae bacterium]